MAPKTSVVLIKKESGKLYLFLFNIDFFVFFFQVWSQKDYPLIPFGRMTLNRNPKNYFAEVEQSAFCPAHLVPGIEASPDKMLQVPCR